MIPHMSHVMTLANSIIGVSVLAMPFCFKQCGIVLAVLLLLLCSVLSRLACHFLIKSAVISRRRNFELLAFHAFGHMGKFLAELFIIGFMLGTCIAYFVVVGDLGPQIIGKMISKTPANIRSSLLVITGVFLVLPLGLLRNIDSLASICTATIVFYLCLVLKIMGESTYHIFAGDWFNDVNYWRPDGILQCLPIFSMALFCQTQLFEIYETIPNVSLEKMNEVVRGALNMCTLVYVCVGLFGYIAFCTQSFTGNILLSFDPSVTSDLIKLGFVFSVAFSFPLVIFPCRASLNSLLFRRMHTHEASVNYLPESRFRCLTIAIVGISLVIGILVPNIEFVLGIVGSTIGVMICLIFPAVFFISISTKNTNERLIAQGILFVGVWIMVLGTYANLYAMEKSTSAKPAAITSKPLGQVNNLPLNIIKENLHIIPDVPDSLDFVHRANDKSNKLPEMNVLEKDVRQEPPIPVERLIVTEKPLNVEKSDKITPGTLVPEVKEMVETIKTINVVDLNAQVAVSTDIAKIDVPVTLKAEEKIKIIEEKERSMDLQKNDNLIDLDAIKKEESELAADGDVANARAAERHEQLRKTLEKHKLEQRQMMQEQKKILKDIKEQKQELEREKQRMAKDESLKKIEEVRINADDVLTKSKNGPREDGKKTAANSENNIENGKKSLPERKGQDVVNNAESNKKQQSRDETHDINIAADNGDEKNLNLLRKMSHNANVEGSRKISEDAPVPVTEKIAERVAPLRNEKRDEEKMEQVKFNDSVNMKGPILNVLSKGALRRSVAEEELPKEIDKKEEIANEALVRTPDKEHDDRYSVPIALKMTNQSKADKTAITQSSNKSEPMILAIRRDILENNEREKRDAEVANDTKIDRSPETFGESLAKNVNDAEICSKDDSKTSKVEKEVEKQTTSTTEALIKTNVYLSEQGMTRPIPLENSPHLGLSGGEYASIKQRDLKTLDFKNNIEI